VAYHLVHEHFAYLGRAVREQNGTIVKTMGDAVMAVISDPTDAVHSALSVQEGVQEFNRNSGSEDIVIKVGLHGGSCVAVTLNEQLDYFGTTINMAAQLQALSIDGDIVLSTWMVADPGVREILEPFQLEIESQLIPGFDDPVTVHRLSAETLTAKTPAYGAGRANDER
jgi:class 3 adenylate cyclase